jgi:hypothetical protein
VYVRSYVPPVTAKLVQQLSPPIPPAPQLVTPSDPDAQFGIAAVDDGLAESPPAVGAASVPPPPALAPAGPLSPGGAPA